MTVADVAVLQSTPKPVKMFFFTILVWKLLRMTPYNQLETNYACDLCTLASVPVHCRLITFAFSVFVFFYQTAACTHQTLLFCSFYIFFCQNKSIDSHWIALYTLYQISEYLEGVFYSYTHLQSWSSSSGKQFLVRCAVSGHHHHHHRVTLTSRHHQSLVVVGSRRKATR